MVGNDFPMVNNTNLTIYDSNITNKFSYRNVTISGLESEGKMVYEEIKLELWILAVVFLCIALVAICGNGIKMLSDRISCESPIVDDY